MKVYLDANVFIDVLTKRANWEGSLRVVNLVRRAPQIEGFASTLTVPLLYFFRLRVASETQARADAEASVKGFRQVALTQDLVHKALALDLPDFEDNIQLVSADTVAADHFLTRNKKHFRHAQISVLAPEEWLTMDTVAGIETNLQE